MPGQTEAVKERSNSKSTTSNPTAGRLSHSTENSQARPLQPTWNIAANNAKGKVTDRCLWSACKAMAAGVFLIAVGAGMATLGFYADQLSTVEETKGNTTVWVKNESKDTHLGSLTYLGPVVMGVGGFTIVAACVMTFEARDTAAKIVPIWFRRTRIHVVSGGSGSTQSGRSSKTSWERFLSQQRTSDDGGDTRSAITQALVNFSKYLQSNVDTSKMPKHGLITQHGITIRKCPSEPNLAKLLKDKCGDNTPESVALLEASTPQPSQRTGYGGGLKTMTGATRPQLLSVAPDTYRQAVSMDCPRPARLQRQEAQENHPTEANSNIPLLITDGTCVQTLILQTSCTTSSSGSMSVDIYLPQGNVTLRVHDDMKDTSKRSPLVAKDSDESRSVRFSQQSDIHSFDEEFIYAETDDSVFLNQDIRIPTPKIVLETTDTKNANQVLCSDNHSLEASCGEQLSIEDWENCVGSSSNREASIDSLEMNFSHGSPRSLSSATPYSFEYSDLDSPGLSITSVVSIPQSSKNFEQKSLSQTDNSFINVSSLNSLGSSQDLYSPVGFTGSPREPHEFFARSEDISDAHFSQELVRTLSKNSDSAISDHYSININDICDLPPKCQHSPIDFEKLSSEPVRKPASPRLFSSLESADVLAGKSNSDSSPKRQQLSLDACESGSDVTSAATARFLSPHTGVKGSSSSSSSRALSPRKTRSESLPERRTHGKSATLKRFPLLRQGALDAFAEERGSTQKVNKSPRHSNTRSQSSSSDNPPSSAS